MGYSVKILKDSIGPARRITTFELTYPRMVHAELMTHKLFSRNSASSRAIPNEKLRQRVLDDPAMPVWWGKNQSGMQAREELSDDHWKGAYPGGNPRQGLSERAHAQLEWLKARDLMLIESETLAKIGLHKQLCNRLIEPWMFITVIVTATEWANWYHQRDHKDAQPEIAHIAKMMRQQHEASEPQKLAAGEWHLPLIDADDWKWALAEEKRDPAASAIEMLKMVSTGRCARVSYLTHDGKRDPREDMALHDRLIAGIQTGEPLHMSPFEHVAQAMSVRNWNDWAMSEVVDAIAEIRPFDQTVFGNVIGWKQYRKFFKGEHFRGGMR